jgi:transcriptional regulator with XRE-family HTH domain
VSILASPSTLISGQAAGMPLVAALAAPGIATPTVPLAESRPAYTERASDLFNTWVRLPDIKHPRPNGLQQQTKQIRNQTGWSQRRLASVLNTTHPTVKALELGRSVTRVRDITTRLADIHRVVERVFLLANRDAATTDRLLSTKPSRLQSSAAELLQVGDSAGAYLAALRVFNPPSSTDDLIVGTWPTTPGLATASLEPAESD